VHFIRINEYKLVWFSKIKRFWRTISRISEKICYLITLCFEVFKRAWSYSLWFKAWEYIIKRSNKVWDKNYRFWQFLFLRWKSIYLYIIQILSCSRNYFRDSLHNKHRYVVFRLYYGRILYRIPFISRRGWNGIIKYDNGGMWDTFLRSIGCELEEEKVLWW